MTLDEQAELDALAKVVSMSRPPAGTLPLYVEAVALLTRAWAHGLTCLMCGTDGTRHPCRCPHNQARKWARKRDMWPLDRQAA